MFSLDCLLCFSFNSVSSFLFDNSLSLSLNDSFSVGEESSSGEKLSDDDDDEEEEDSDGKFFYWFCFPFSEVACSKIFPY